MEVEEFAHNVRRIAHNYVVVPPPEGCPYDGVAKMWFATAVEARKAVDGVARDMTTDDRAELLVSGRAVLETSYTWSAEGNHTDGTRGVRRP